MDDQRLCLDRITSLPPSIIETILCRLPTKEAVRTSILSTDWKYHWTKLPKFEFVEDGESTIDGRRNQYLGEPTHTKSKLFSAINQVMSMHECPIQEFSLSTYVRGACLEVDHIIENFSRNNDLKKLKLDTWGYSIPGSFFSLHKLTDLYLRHCRLDVQPTFSGFGSLTNLFMDDLKTTKRMLQLFLSGCPLLKTVVLIPNFGSLPDNDDSTLIQLFECLPVIENLTVTFSIMKFYDQGRVPNQLPAALVHLKHLCILDADYRYRFHCYVFMIRSCPNLEKLTLKISNDLRMPGEDFITWDNYSDIWLRHLNEVEIHFSTTMTWFESIMLIFAKSPVLKTVKILLFQKASMDEKLRIKWIISRYPRASRGVKFIIKRGVRMD